jgi:amidase
VPDEVPGPEADLFHAALEVLKGRGAVLVEVPAIPESDELPVLLHEFAPALDAYLARLPDGAPIRSMKQLVAWNDAHAAEALKFGQVHLETAAAVDHEAERAAYELKRARDLSLAGEHGIDATLAMAGAAAIVFPGAFGCGYAARAGYPSLVVPAGYRSDNRRPAGLGLVGPSRNERVLLALAAAYEEAANVRRPPSLVNPSLLRGVGGSAATG